MKKNRQPVVVVTSSSSSDFENDKIEQITRCLENHEVNLWKLRKLALTKGGLINSEMRRKAWPKLVGIDRSILDGIELSIHHHKTIPLDLKEEWDTIERDKNRSVLSRFPELMEESGKHVDNISRLSSPTNNNSAMPTLTTSLQTSADSCAEFFNDSDLNNKFVNNPNLKKYQNNLALIIQSMLFHHSASTNNTTDRLHYYQGFHDIAAMFLMNLQDPKLTLAVLKKVAPSHFREAMRPDFSNLVWFLRRMIYPLIEILDEEVHYYLMSSGVDLDLVLPWLITWFCHDLGSGENASRLFDAFLASHPLMPTYFTVAMLLHPRNRIQIISSECDHALMHMTIVNLLSQVSSDQGEHAEGAVTFQDLIDQSVVYMKDFPPRSLISLAKNYQYGSQEPILKRALSISLLKSPATWSLASTALSDYIVPSRKKRLRKRGKKDKYVKRSFDSPEMKKFITTTPTKTGIMSSVDRKNLQIQSITPIGSSSDEDPREICIAKIASGSISIMGDMSYHHRNTISPLKRRVLFSSILESTYDAIGFVGRILTRIKISSKRKRLM